MTADHEPENLPRIVKDFIYLDVERLYSLSSQIFGGVIQQIEHVSQSGSGSADTVKGRFGGGEAAESRAMELRQRTENRVLYDAMYDKLERALAGTIIDLGTVPPEEIGDVLRAAPYVQAQGAAEIEDYERVGEFMNNFNRMSEIIAYAALASTDDASTNVAGSESMTTRTGKGKKRKRPPREKPETILARELGMSQDPKILENLKFFGDFFGRGAFDITVLLEQQPSGPLAVRARANREWLRQSPETLRSLYGGVSEWAWTVVGQVTYASGVRTTTGGSPQVDERVSEQQSEVASDTASKTQEVPTPSHETPPTLSDGDGNPSMRDPWRAFFSSMITFERMFFDSATRQEVIVSPLAIYREIELSTQS